MTADDFRKQLFAQVDLRLGVIPLVALVLHDLEPQVIERSPHLVKLVLGLDDDFVEALFDRPQLLLLGEGAEEPAAAPVAAGPANPGVEHAAAGEVDRVAQPIHEIGQLGLGLGDPDLVRHLERNRHD